MKVAVINFSGNTGKSTLTKNLLVPMIPNAKRISIEDLNEGDGKSDVEISASLFRNLAAELNVADDEDNFVIDIGASAAKEMLVHFATLRTTRSDINFWVVPVTPQLKQRGDTLNTVRALMEIGVKPESIVVVPNLISDIALFQGDFAQIAAAATEMGFSMCSEAVLLDAVYDMTKNTNASMFDIAAEATDFKALRKKYKTEPEKLEHLGRQMVIHDSAEQACENLRAVFAATPLARALEMARPVTGAAARFSQTNKR